MRITIMGTGYKKVRLVVFLIVVCKIEKEHARTPGRQTRHIFDLQLFEVDDCD